MPRRRELIAPALLTGLLLALLLWMVGRAGPDEAAHGPAIANDVVLDLATAGVRGPRTYIVQRGDTLGHIAQRELGSVRHMRAIQALNPMLVPKRMKEGDPVRLPPREDARAITLASDAGSGAPGGAWTFYLWRRDPAGPSGRLSILTDGARVKDMDGPTVLLATPLPQARAVEQALREASAFGQPLPRLAELRTSQPIEPVAYVGVDDETMRIEHHLRVRGVREQAILLDVESVRLDAKGRVIAPLPAARSRFLTLLMLGLSIVGVVVLVLYGAKRLEAGATRQSMDRPPLFDI